MTTTNRHTSNQRMFGQLDASEQLFQLYCRLVALELALKNFNHNNFGLSHDVCQMAIDTFASNSAVAAAATTLNGDLSSLICSDRSGSPTNIMSKKYPDLRYLRRPIDFSPPSSNDAEIARALKSLESLIDELRRGGLPWH
jgi:hypothetical protein